MKRMFNFLQEEEIIKNIEFIKSGKGVKGVFNIKFPKWTIIHPFSSDNGYCIEEICIGHSMENTRQGVWGNIFPKISWTHPYVYITVDMERTRFFSNTVCNTLDYASLSERGKLELEKFIKSPTIKKRKKDEDQKLIESIDKLKKFCNDNDIKLENFSIDINPPYKNNKL